MDKYIIVKVRDADALNERFQTNLGLMRKAIHNASYEYGISAADMVTHSPFFPDADSAKVKDIFETHMMNVKKAAFRRANPLKIT